MNSALDFVTRARHAVKEFRQPSELDVLGRQQRDPEKGEHRESTLHPDPSHYHPDERSPLESFRLLVGIHQDKSFSPPHGFQANRRPQLSIEHRPSPNLGIYSTVCDAEIKQKRNYKFTSRLINCCLGLQIVVAASLTALGAADGSRTAVTVFGAINTVIAGFLTYLKGSGLPHRLKYYQHEWAKVREYIEQRERDFSFGLLTKDHVLGEVSTIRQMYEMVRADIEMNTPDRFVGSNTHTIASPPRLQVADSAVGKQFSEKQAEAQVALDKAQASAAGLFGQARGIKDMLENRIHDLGHMKKEMETEGQRMVDEKKQGIASQVQETVKDVAHLGKELETKARAVLADGKYAYQKTQDQARTFTTETADNAAAALAQQRAAAGNAIAGASNTATAAIDQQRQGAEQAIYQTSDAARNTMNQQQQGAAQAIQQTSDAAREALDQQRQAAATAIAPRDDVPSKPS